jgi:hypothetical protein
MRWGEIFLRSYVPMERFLMGRIKKTKRHEEERDRSGNSEKHTLKNGGKKKKRFFFKYMEVPILI